MYYLDCALNRFCTRLEAVKRSVQNLFGGRTPMTPQTPRTPVAGNDDTVYEITEINARPLKNLDDFNAFNEEVDGDKNKIKDIVSSYILRNT